MHTPRGLGAAPPAASPSRPLAGHLPVRPAVHLWNAGGRRPAGRRGRAVSCPGGRWRCLSSWACLPFSWFSNCSFLTPLVFSVSQTPSRSPGRRVFSRISRETTGGGEGGRGGGRGGEADGPPGDASAPAAQAEPATGPAGRVHPERCGRVPARRGSEKPLRLQRRARLFLGRHR